MKAIDYIARFTAIGLNGYTITHLIRWVETHRTEEERDETLSKIYSALANDPRLVDDHSWPELERMSA